MKLIKKNEKRESVRVCESVCVCVVCERGERECVCVCVCVCERVCESECVVRDRERVVCV